MLVHATTNKVLFTKATDNGWDVVQVRSSSNPSKTYTVDMTHGRCSCPAWIFQKTKLGETRATCKHLKKLGFKQLIEAAELDFQEAPKVSIPVTEKVKA
jgi:hypothetical protein